MLSPRRFRDAAIVALGEACGRPNADAVVAALDADPEAAVQALRLFARAAREITDGCPESEVRATLRDLVHQLADLRTRAARRRAA